MYLFEAALDGKPLTAIAPELLLLDIQEAEPKEDSQSTPRAMHHGSLRFGWARRSLKVTLICMIRTQHIEHRTQVMQQVAAWAANGGWLTINTRPGQRLRVAAEKLPTIGSANKWTDEIKIELVAFERPYWEMINAASAVITDAGVLRFGGMLPTSPAEVSAVNLGTEAMTSITFRCGETAITLSGLKLAAGKTVSITYTDADLMQILADGASALSCRTADSDDDLQAAILTDNPISVTADQPVSATFSVRGRFY